MTTCFMSNRSHVLSAQTYQLTRTILRLFNLRLLEEKLAINSRCLYAGNIMTNYTEMPSRKKHGGRSTASIRSLGHSNPTGAILMDWHKVVMSNLQFINQHGIIQILSYQRMFDDGGTGYKSLLMQIWLIISLYPTYFIKKLHKKKPNTLQQFIQRFLLLQGNLNRS